jgi:hypothetical protein
MTQGLIGAVDPCTHIGKPWLIDQNIGPEERVDVREVLLRPRGQSGEVVSGGGWMVGDGGDERRPAAKQTLT